MKHPGIIKRSETLKILRLAVIWVIFFLATGSIYATSITVSGNVSGTWNTDTVFVEGNLIIPTNETLLIQPGTFVMFKAYFRLDVHGRIQAVGAPGDTIIFTVCDTSNFANQANGKGGWSGIRFGIAAVDSDSSLFVFCSFKFGKAVGDSANCYGGAIQVKNFNRIRVSDCLFYHNYSYYSGGSVYLWNASISINNCQFKQNYAGNTGAIYGYGGGICSLFSSPVIQGNDFFSNISTGVGGGASFDNSNPVFNNNILENNFSGLGGALGILRSAPAGTLANNLVINNEARFFGGGICCIRSFPVFSNLTVAGNKSSYGGGFYCNDSAVPSMYNSIIWGNTGLGNSVYIWDVRSAPNFYYCDIEGDTSNFEGSGGQEGYHGIFENNINSDPLFSLSISAPYYLSGGSPCIDAGIPDPALLQLPVTDISGAERIFNGRIDIGAFEYYGNVGFTGNSAGNPNTLLVSPNPFCRETIITLPQKLNKIITIQVNDVRGNCIRQLQMPPNEISIVWDGRNDKGNEVVQGFYLFKISTPQMIVTGKVVKGF